MSILNPSASVLVWDTEIEVRSIQTWMAQSGTVQNWAITQPSMSLLLTSHNWFTSILCYDRVTQYGQDLHQHCSALTLLDIHLTAGWWWLSGCWLEQCDARKGREGKEDMPYFQSQGKTTYFASTYTVRAGHWLWYTQWAPTEIPKGQVTR